MIAPQDLRTADATRASEIYGGRFAFAGKVVICDRRSPFEMMPPSDEWAVILLSFAWLRHLRAADSAITRANARALIDDWITIQGSWHPLGWRNDILSRRILCWLSQAPFVLQDADARFYRRFIRSLSRQVRYLRRTLKHSRDGLPRLQALIALNYASLCLQGQSGALRSNARRLIEELRAQILPDGGHISRNPGTLIELLADLLPLRQLFSARNLQPPQAINNAIDRMMPMLRFFRHADGNFAQFNGMGPTPVDLLATVLAYDDARGAPVSNAPHSGYQRIDAGADRADDGHRPAAADGGEPGGACRLPVVRAVVEAAPAGGQLRPAGGQPRELAAGGARHRRAFDRHVQRARRPAGSSNAARCAGCWPACRSSPARATCASTRDEHADGVDAARLARRLCRRFRHRPSRARCACRPTAARSTARTVSRRRTASQPGGSAPTNTPSASTCTRRSRPAGCRTAAASSCCCPTRRSGPSPPMADAVQLEESVYLAGPEGPRRTVQIVIYGHARKRRAVRWSFRHTPPAPPGARPDRLDEPELPLGM